MDHPPASLGPPSRSGRTFADRLLATVLLAHGGLSGCVAPPAEGPAEREPARAPATSPSYATFSWSTYGSGSGHQLGQAVASAGDVNGDGYRDVLVGAPGYQADRGKVYLFLGTATGVSAQPSWSVVGGSADDDLGWAVSGAGDVNADGYDDVLVGAPGRSSHQGAAYLYLGSPAGPSATPASTLVPSTANGAFGQVVAAAGDLNGDGYADLAVGAPGYNLSSYSVRIYLGSATGRVSSSPVWTFTGTSSGTYGVAIRAAGDVNGDGLDDLLVGAPGASSQRGEVYLYPGGRGTQAPAPLWTAAGEGTSHFFGAAVASAGDLNGDGYADVVVGAPGVSSGKGKTYLFPGAAAGPSSTPTWTAQGESNGNSFGAALSQGSDLTGDGAPDLVVGAPGWSSQRGKIYLFAGATQGLSTAAGWSTQGNNTQDYLGAALATLGDVEGDGDGDLIVGVIGAGATGEARVFAGAAPTPSAGPSQTLAGEAPTYDVGIAIAGAGDVNGDGFADVLVGGEGTTNGAGWASLHLGGEEGVADAPRWSATGENPGGSFGAALAGAGDVNGDGLGDVVVADVEFDTSSGKVYLWLGAEAGPALAPDWTFTGTQDDQRMGAAVASAGDVNGDGRDDVLVSADGEGGFAGAAYLFLGDPAGLSPSPIWRVAGEAEGDVLGVSVASAGDIDGDGYSDVAVGAYGAAGYAGRVYLYRGSPSGLATTPATTLQGEGTYSLFGAAVSSAGDTNADGFDDLLVGAPSASNYAGRAYLFLGGAAGLKSSWAWRTQGSATGDVLGEDLACAGDLDGDGDAEVLVAARGAASKAGRVLLFTGAPGGLSSASVWSVTGAAAGDALGTGLASVGDVDGDGLPDLGAGAPQALGGCGAAYVALAEEPELPPTPEPTDPPTPEPTDPPTPQGEDSPTAPQGESPTNGEPSPTAPQGESPTNGEPSPTNGEPSPTDGEPSPTEGEPSPTNGEPGGCACSSSQPGPLPSSALLLALACVALRRRRG